MQRITTASRSLNLFGTGKDGFKNGNLSTGDAPTSLNAEWFNGAQEELMALIENAGLTANGGDLTQVLQALDILIRRKAGHGQCRLALSGGNLKLSPYNGNKLMINGAVQSVPAAGLTLAAAGLTAGVLYYIYAYMNAGVMTLEASTTGHSADATTGVEIKTGDATRTLVGMARPIAGPAWQDSAAQRFVLTWFNRRAIGGYKPMSATDTTTSLTPAVIGASDKAEFLTWADEAVDIKWHGNAVNSSGSIQTLASIGLDGALAAGSSMTGSLGAASTTISVAMNGSLSEGYHYACFIGWVASASTGSFEVMAGTRSQLMHVYLIG